MAQAPYWVTRAGGPGVERIADVKVGANDNVFTVGHFTAGASVGGQGLISQGSTDILVMKQTSSGVVLWIVTCGGPGIDMAAKVQPVADGSVYVCGEFTGSAVLFGVPVNANGEIRGHVRGAPERHGRLGHLGAHGRQRRI